MKASTGPEWVDIPRTLRACQACMKSQDQETVDAAESIMSYIIIHLKDETAVLPKELRTRYQRVVAYNQQSR
jgi:hypothetical protein